MDSLLKNTQKKASFFIISMVMWEFFSFYGLKSILILYLTSQLHLSDATAYEIFGNFAALVFVTPMIGGWLADRYCGYRYAAALGCILIILGHITLAVFTYNIYIGLSLLTMGIGFFKSNAICLISSCYPDDSVGTSSAFSWYYVSGNLGSMISQIICPYLVEKISWHAGFMAAAIGMVLGLIMLILSKPYFRWERDSVKMRRWHQFSFLKKAIGSVSVILLLLALTYYTLYYNWVGSLLLFTGVVAAAMLISIYRKTDPIHKKSLIMIGVLTVFAAAYWIFNNQGANSVPLFILRYVNRDLFGFIVPTGMFQALNPASILIFGTIMAVVWRWLGQRNIRPQSESKLSIALLFLMIGFFIIAYGAKLANTHGSISLLFPLFGLLIIGCAEIFVDPVLLAAISDIAPPNTEGQLVAIYYLIIGAFANYLAIVVAKWTIDPMTNKATALTYNSAYLQIAYIASALFGLLLLRVIFRKRT
ncbi:MAG: hypothetical protein A3F67_02875 [Verrucomicrobia bacterium RIFCSPHIGHO2_12_FULL_41_10]|nr:MAG: hypothetical protein A3F67_02875 [Verrucomicrobia bacterium RIFCSPHIGHO2_12_FULL_41_10]HLB33283.1 peptide MFS transporter [Chthoniobacterales bacterium]